MILGEMLDERLSQNFDLWWQFDVFTQGLIGNMVNSTDLVALTAALFKQRLTKMIKEELQLELTVSKIMQSPPDHLLWVSVRSSLNAIFILDTHDVNNMTRKTKAQRKLSVVAWKAQEPFTNIIVAFHCRQLAKDVHLQAILFHFLVSLP